MSNSTIVHATGDLRRAAQQYLETNHSMRSAGGSGTMFAVVPDDRTDVCGAVLIGATASANCDRSLVAGAMLIGPTASHDAERRIAQPGVLVRQIKRSHLTTSTDLRDVPVSQAQCDTLFDLSQVGDIAWQTFMQRVIASAADSDE